MTDRIAEQTHSIITTPDGARLACYRLDGKEPGVIFLHGLQSDMTGAKAQAVETWCRDTGHAFLRFDQQGHGRSSGRFEDGRIGRWARDTVYMIETLGAGRTILVGSSMGGWLMLLAALAVPHRVCGLVGLAAAPDFTVPLTPSNPMFAQAFDADGTFYGPESADPTFPRLRLSPAFLEEGNRNAVLGRAPVAVDRPVRLLHGLLDATVPWETALKIQAALAGQDVTVTLIKDGDHRLSRPQDLRLLRATLAALVSDVSAP